MRRFMAAVAVAITFLPGCSGSSSSVGGAGGNGTVASVQVPAGVQFTSMGALPVGFRPYGDPAKRGSALVVAGTMRDSSDGAPGGSVVYSADGGATWQRRELPPGVSAPPGYPDNRSGFVPLGAAAGDPGFVIAGTAAWADNGFTRETRADFVWTSADGNSWRAIDLRAVVGGGTEAIQLLSVHWIGQQFVAVGASAPLDTSSGPSRALVLTSSDGVTWARDAAPAAAWSTEARDVSAFGGGLAITGVEYVCTADASAFNTFSLGAQPRIWTSVDSGKTWKTASIPDALVGGAKPAPKDSAGCAAAGATGPDAIDSHFAQRLGALGAAGTLLVAWSSDHATAATSKDGETWSSLGVPGAVAQKGIDDVTAPKAALIAISQDLPVLISLEDRRDAGDKQSGGGLQTVVWRLTDGAWVRQPAGRPIATVDNPTLHAVSDSVWLLEGADTASLAATATGVAVSDAGTLLDWSTCAPKAHANCGFATLKNVSLANADLTGINLDGATVTGGDFSGANLTSAQLTSATLSDVKLNGVTLKGVEGKFAHLGRADLTGADLTGADLAYTSLPVSLFGAHGVAQAQIHDASVVIGGTDSLANAQLAGLDLSSVSFVGSGGLRPMTGANFQAAKLTGARFEHVDLSGANFSGATLTDSYFGSDTVCPDGKPASPGVSGPGACRLA